MSETLSPSFSKQLDRLGLKTPWDAWMHFPLRYENQHHVCSFHDLKEGQSATLQGTITSFVPPNTPRQKLRVLLCDGAQIWPVVFFHAYPSMRQKFQIGHVLRGFGEVRSDRQGLYWAHPDFWVAQDVAHLPPLKKTWVPVYPTTQGLSQKRLTGWLERQQKKTEWSSWELLEEEGWSVARALHFIHQPPPDAVLTSLLDRSHPAFRCLARHELACHWYVLEQQRAQETVGPACALEASKEQQEALQKRFGHALTHDQAQAIEAIQADLKQNKPMYRLLQGDVGSGKTIVAAHAALAAMALHQQVVVLAPTEVLARQLHHLFHTWLDPDQQGKVLLLVGGMKAKGKQHALNSVASGEALVVVGTHAVFQDEVVYANLALVVVDEQHRFGVNQRLALQKKAPEGRSVHRLMMSATPIPRTSRMVAYGDVAVSLLREKPQGRLPIHTTVCDSSRKKEVMARVAAWCEQGEQAYWVCGLIEASEHSQAEPVLDLYAAFEQAHPHLKTGLLHGRMNSAEKEKVLAAFKAGALSLLLSTSVVEVGVDVPQAHLMIIDNAERLGLAQCHQLRGRVGRDAAQSHCVLICQQPLSVVAQQRLKALKTSQDGFWLAEQDFLLRGGGAILGRQQSGLEGFKVLDLARDQAIVPKAQASLTRWLAVDQTGLAHYVARWHSQDEVCYHA